MVRAFSDQTVPARRAKPKNRGFTLLEVIIAFIIMALILGATFDTFSTGLRQAALTDHYAGAVVRAESHLALLDRTEPLSAGIRTGRFDQFYAWRTVVAPVRLSEAEAEAEAEEEGQYLLYNVVITVFWRTAGETREVTLRSQRLTALNKS